MLSRMIDLWDMDDEYIWRINPCTLTKQPVVDRARTRTYLKIGGHKSTGHSRWDTPIKGMHEDEGPPWLLQDNIGNWNEVHGGIASNWRWRGLLTRTTLLDVWCPRWNQQYEPEHAPINRTAAACTHVHDKWDKDERTQRQSTYDATVHTELSISQVRWQLGIKKETQKSKPNPINENKLSQKVKPIHTVQDFAVCIGVAEIRK